MENTKNLIDNAFMADIAECMDNDIREQVHFKFAPCSNDTFLREYLKLDDTNLAIIELLHYHGIHDFD